jgi:hypothetical protein
MPPTPRPRRRAVALLALLPVLAVALTACENTVDVPVVCDTGLGTLTQTVRTTGPDTIGAFDRIYLDYQVSMPDFDAAFAGREVRQARLVIPLPRQVSNLTVELVGGTFRLEEQAAGAGVVAVALGQNGIVPITDAVLPTIRITALARTAGETKLDWTVFSLFELGFWDGSRVRYLSCRPVDAATVLNTTTVKPVPLPPITRLPTTTTTAPPP